ncbi:MAG: response regulator [Elusimicrobiota bacterium]
MKSKKIVVIDDDRVFLEEINETLALNGYMPTVFSDGKSALQNMIEIQPDVILLDIKMENMHGFQVAEEIQQSPQLNKIPIIVITGFLILEENEKYLRECGVNTYIMKPFQPDKLIQVIKIVLSKNYVETQKMEKSCWKTIYSKRNSKFVKLDK